MLGAKSAEFGERSFDVLAVRLTAAGGSSAARAAARGGRVHNGDFAESVTVKGLLEGGDGAFPPVGTGCPYVSAQVPDLLVLVTQDVNDVRRDHSLEDFHGRPLCVVRRRRGPGR